jgi:hypothetical protein
MHDIRQETNFLGHSLPATVVATNQTILSTECDAIPGSRKSTPFDYSVFDNYFIPLQLTEPVSQTYSLH